MEADNITDTNFESLNTFKRNENIIHLSELGAAAEIMANETHYFVVPSTLKSELLTLTTCSVPNGSNGTLSLVVGGSVYTDSTGFVKYTEGGLSAVEVVAPEGSGSWTYELGIGPSSSWAFDANDTDLFYVDSDFANALLVTSPLTNVSNDLATAVTTKGWGNSSANVSVDTLQISLFPYESVANGLSRSYCALNRAPLLNQLNADRSYTHRGVKQQERAQYLLPGLNKSTDYVAFLSYSNANLNTSANPPPLGGVVLGPALFRTKESTACQLVYNMSFCSEMAFAVPGNASAFTVNELTLYYDNMARARYENFSKSLQQEPCDAPLDDRYSVLRTCDDCDKSYRNWLCAITIPRCADWSRNDSYLFPRPQGQSRNPEINENIDPGKYKEVLPCKELCYNLVRDCPASLGFSCPNRHMINLSYGSMSDDGDVTCSYPGAVYFEDAALRLAPSWLLAVVLFFIVAM